EGKIYKNIYIENIDVSGLTKSEAVKKINSSVYKDNIINLTYEDKNYKLNLNDINFVYEIEKASSKAYEVSRKDGLINNIKTKMNLYLGHEINLNLQIRYEKEKLESYISNLAQQINVQPVNAEIKVNENEFVISKETNGIKVNEKELFEIVDKNLINKEFSSINIPVNKMNPEYTFESLSKINTILGKYETEFNDANNIKVAINNISSMLINSNSEFSFNKFIGKRSLERGFKEAPVIVNGELKPGMGGGICQVSSTIYNSALYAGLEIIQAKNHSIPSSYIPKGRDAAVSYGNIDLVFRNNYSYPILIQNKVEGNKIISTIYGNEQDKREVDINTCIVETIEPKITVKESDKLNPGNSEVESKGRKGYKVNTYRIYKKPDGEIEKKEFINESYYPPKNKIIIKGTKKNDSGINEISIKII
ncbi:MAG: VanW family protein, partial [Romboutsia sp.]